MIDLDHPFHFLIHGVVSEKKFDERADIGRLNADVNTDHKWDFETNLFFLVVVKVQVEGSAGLERVEKCNVPDQVFYELLDAFRTLGWGAPSLVARPSEN